tara:strand:- start:154 stop:534 length:381 start_codon:yes stop_codon:yes gene_type:complete
MIISKKMIDLLNSWVEKIKTNDAAQVADLYHRDGLLLGTFSNSERKGQKLIFDYFENLFSSHVDVMVITKHEYNSDSISTASGFYNFEVNGIIIKARFSFVFLKMNDNWKILSHHSSVLPNENKTK